jgi:DNA polymerase-3 subunit epsilon
MSWQTEEWRIYDFETTGPDPETAHVCQVGVVLMRAGQVLTRRSLLCNPGIPIPEEATEIHGITDEMVASATPEAELLAKVSNWIMGARVIVHYNGLHYDAPILRRVLGEASEIRRSDCAEVDVLTLVRSDKIGRWWKGKGRHKLTAVADRFGIDASGAHDAAVDCIATGRVLWHMIQAFPWVATLPDGPELSMLIAEMAQKQEDDFQRWLARQPKQEA